MYVNYASAALKHSEVHAPADYDASQKHVEVELCRLSCEGPMRWAGRMCDIQQTVSTSDFPLKDFQQSDCQIWTQEGAWPGENLLKELFRQTFQV